MPQIAEVFFDPLPTMHAWFWGLLFFGLILVAGEAGFRLGRRSRVRHQQETRKLIDSVEVAVLGVLGLLLAFSLVMAVSRFDRRRDLVLEEANAIHASYWRSQLIPAPEGPALAGLLLQYVDAQVHYFDAGVDPGRLEVSRERTARLQTDLWSQAQAAAQKDSRSIPTGLLLQSLNQTFELENSRWTELQIHVPTGVIGVDVIVGLLAGYNFGVAGNRNLISWFLLAVCIATVLAVIVDLDQPRQGLIQVDQRPLIDLQRQLQENH
jgi:hypothetical protein